ncbi:hypothetical protein [Spirosoma harenae]
MFLPIELQGFLLFPLIAFGLFWLYRKLTFNRTCPACGDKHPDRIPRPTAIRLLLGFLPLQHYWCVVCRNKFYNLGKENLQNA